MWNIPWNVMASHKKNKISLITAGDMKELEAIAMPQGRKPSTTCSHLVRSDDENT